jgi:lipopolysaccharide heptosyltransferase II
VNLSLVKYVDRYLGIALCYAVSVFHLFREMIFPAEYTIQPRRILIVKLWGLGNIVMILPVIRAMRRRYPDATIHFLTIASNREILERCPDLDGLHLIDAGSPRRLFASGFRTLGRLRRANIDLIVDFEQFSRASALFGYALGAPQRIGFNTPGQGRGHIYTVQVPVQENRHMSETFFDLARAAGVEQPIYIPLAPTIDDADREAVDRWLAARGASDAPLVVMHPGSGDNFPGRRWPAESFAEVAESLVRRHGARVILTGTPNERAVVREVRHHASVPLDDAVGAFRIRELCALIERAHLVCSNDTGPVHLAAAIGRPVVGLYGPNTPRLYGPVGTGHAVFYRNLPCSPCITNSNYKTSFCRMPVCMTNIRPADVTEAADRLLSESLRRDPARAAVGA